MEFFIDIIISYTILIIYVISD